MADDAIRRFPRLEVTVGQIEALLSPLLSGRGIRALQSVDGGLTNTILRAWPADGGRALLVRIFAGGRTPWERERNILSRLQRLVPVPEVLLADDGGGSLPFPSLVCPWIEGLDLNSFRAQRPASELLRLGAPLGRLLARVSSVTFEVHLGLDADRQAPVSSVDSLLSVSRQRLLNGRARTRLGDTLANAIWRCLSTQAPRFRSLGAANCLVHGDLGGRNILVAPAGKGGWRISGLVDWEEAFNGWALWDVGSLFRYPTRYGQAFREQFEEGYRGAGGVLPEEWWETARLLDASRQVATLDGERERPTVLPTAANC